MKIQPMNIQSINKATKRNFNMPINNYFSKFYFLLFIIILSACSNTPSHFIIEPNIVNTPSANYNNKTAQLEVTDVRTARHLVQISEEGEAAILFSAEKRIEETIENTLTTQWKKQSLLINRANTNSSSNTNTSDTNTSKPINNTNKIHIIIEKAITRVTQYTLNYQIKTEIIIKVRINNGLQTQTTTFKNTGNSEGALQADIAALESDFNQNLTSVLTQVLSNKKIQSFLK